MIFDVDLAYEAMYKSATLPGAKNLMRPDNDDYMSKGYVPLREQYDNSVSHALEYYIADFALSRFAEALGKKKDAEMFYKRSLGYKHYYSKEFGTFRPILPDGTFYSPFNPRQGENFEPNPGFHEGSAWNYSFYVPHDVYGLAKLMGGKNPFIKKLQMVFDEGLYDPANEPDIAYAHLSLILEERNGARRKKHNGCWISTLQRSRMVFPVMMIQGQCLHGLFLI